MLARVQRHRWREALGGSYDSIKYDRVDRCRKKRGGKFCFYTVINSETTTDVWSFRVLQVRHIGATFHDCIWLTDWLKLSSSEDNARSRLAVCRACVHTRFAHRHFVYERSRENPSARINMFVFFNVFSRVFPRLQKLNTHDYFQNETKIVWSTETTMT